MPDDEMFPSGPWRGYYMYDGREDRHRMDLALTFRDGLIEGGGGDDVNLFAIRGRYDRENIEVWWTKLYPTHDFHYKGFRDGRGIWETWDIGERLRGGFMIWPEGFGEAQSEHAEEEVPVEEDALAQRPASPGAMRTDC